MKDVSYKKVDAAQDVSNCPYYNSRLFRCGYLVTWDEYAGIEQTCADCVYYNNGLCYKEFV